MGEKGAVILIVEDDASHRLLIRKTFENHSVKNRIMEAEDGQQALDYVYGRGQYSDRTAYPYPDLILLDIKMPKVDGFEVLKTLKTDTTTRHIPIIMLTTSSREEEIARGYDYGANAYITKPVDFAAFSEKIKNIKLFWILTAEIPPNVQVHERDR